MQTYDCEYLLATGTVNMYIQDISHMWHSRVAAVYSLSNPIAYKLREGRDARRNLYLHGTCTCSARFRCWCGFEGLLSYEEWGLRQQIVQLPPNKRCSVSDLQCFLLTMSISIHTNRIPKLLTAVYQYTASTLDAFVLTKLSLKQS
jgi:hypothetical protein